MPFGPSYWKKCSPAEACWAVVFLSTFATPFAWLRRDEGPPSRAFNVEGAESWEWKLKEGTQTGMSMLLRGKGHRLKPVPQKLDHR